MSKIYEYRKVYHYKELDKHEYCLSDFLKEIRLFKKELKKLPAPITMYDFSITNYWSEDGCAL